MGAFGYPRRVLIRIPSRGIEKVIAVSLVKDAILDQKIPFACIIVGAATLIASLLWDAAWILVFVPILICGVPIVWGAIVGVVKEHDITADVLVSVAIVASVIIEEYDAAAEIAIIMQIGAFLEEATVNHANASIMRLVGMRPATARVVSDGTESIVPVEDVKLGDVVRIVPGEVVPVDGIVRSGTTSVNNSILTGESVPLDVGPGDRVSSGTVNMYGSVDIDVDRVGDDTTIARMARIIENADAGKSKVVRTADKWAVYIVIIAFAVSILTYVAFQDIIRSVTVLVVFCPCALILATPTAIMAAAGNMSKRGILVKDGGAVERMATVDILLMDKTGTLTMGEIVCHGFTSSSPDVDPSRLAELVSAVESRSEHPLGKAISSYREGPVPEVEDFEYRPGRGVSGIVGGVPVTAGNETLMRETCPVGLDETLAMAESARNDGFTVVLAGMGDRTVGFATLSDTLKQGSADTVADLRSLGLSTIMLTGDTQQVARKMADAIGMDDVVWECLPEDKLRTVTSLEKEGRTCMVGDGINDAPSLKRADVGIAMGGIGNEMATESADIVFVDDDISKLGGVVRLSRRTLLTIKVGIAFSLVLNSIAMIMAVFGLMGPIGGALVHNIGSVIVILMAAMLLRYEPRSSMKGSGRRQEGEVQRSAA